MQKLAGHFYANSFNNEGGPQTNPCSLVHVNALGCTHYGTNATWRTVCFHPCAPLLKLRNHSPPRNSMPGGGSLPGYMHVYRIP